MTAPLDFDLDAELARLGLRPSDLAHLCGVSRVTVWKWRRHHLPVPAHARTILRQQGLIKALAASVPANQPNTK
jgi:hypothetical protein